MKTDAIREVLAEAKYVVDADTRDAALEELCAIDAQGRRDLRDTFAAAALTGLLAKDPDVSHRWAAANAYALADAMLAAREGK